jgi:hypothetical protein
MDKHLPRQAEGQQNRQKGNEQAYIARQLSPGAAESFKQFRDHFNNRKI